MIFKNKHSEKAFFTIEGNTRRCINSIYETEDKKEIEFLTNNSNFIVIEDKEIKPEDDIKIENNDQKTRDFIVENWGV